MDPIDRPRSRLKRQEWLKAVSIASPPPRFSPMTVTDLLGELATAVNDATNNAAEVPGRVIKSRYSPDSISVAPPNPRTRLESAFGNELLCLEHPKRVVRRPSMGRVEKAAIKPA